MDPTAPALLVFAKTPELGRVKTRLARSLGDELALELYRCFLADLVERLSAVPGVRMVVCQAGGGGDADQERAALRELLPWAGEFAWQQGADLGERMAAAMREMLTTGAPKVLIVGADHPTMPSPAVHEGLSALDDAELVFGPADDGGCYLIGARTPCEEAFCGVEWGTPRVLEQCLERAASAGLSAALLTEHSDVDDLADLTLLREDLLARGEAAARALCPRTWDFLQRDDVLPLVVRDTCV